MTAPGPTLSHTGLPMTGSQFEDVAFDPETHRYTVGGVFWPSVTTIIKPLYDFSKIDPDVLARAAEFGTHVHSACHLLNMGTLDEASLSEPLVPYLNGYRMFLKESNARVLASELLVVNRRTCYAGTIDLVLSWGHKMVLADIKTATSVPKSVGPQTAGYARCLLSDRTIRRACLVLRPDGYTLTMLEDPGDFDIFDSCLKIYRWRNS